MSGLPPLNALRAFEAAARHQSFSDAALELSVTPSAISHQVKQLEGKLGVQLFVRQTRAVQLTAAGCELLPEISLAFKSIRQATARIMEAQRGAILTVSTAPVFAMGWLIPRLDAFQREHPAVRVRLDTSVEWVDFSTSDVQIVIRYTDQPRQHGLCTHWLFDSQPVLVCAPSLAAQLHSIHDLGSMTLLHSTTSCGNWSDWLHREGITDIDLTTGLEFANDTLAIEAAMQGLGVAIAHRRIAEQWIDNHRLFVAFDSSHDGTHGYHLMYPESSLSSNEVRAFRDWLLNAVSSNPQLV